ncbi:SRPBCC domain-containing protein [Uliginosibacterium sp. H3]|uniref:SRPBCC domain-containing protein n=1 Tax=Uliginosibacterium silvisoli TaxID=3114758 RepID=A0ABU6K755_9RHOO|nr:SRPBCC domain-containing protein [Uliginosibacterium sp. H3]
MTSQDKSTVQGEALVITRVFDAPRERVFQAFAEAERLAQWWGPVGCTIEVKKLEFRPGGTFHYCMKWPMGDMWGRFVYREIVAPERIVFINSFSDPQGEITRAPFPGLDNWPLEVLNTITLEEKDGKTTLTLSGGPINATAEEVVLYQAGFDSMRQGFGGTWDKLATYLSQSA